MGSGDCTPKSLNMGIIFWKFRHYPEKNVQICTKMGKNLLKRISTDREKWAKFSQIFSLAARLHNKSEVCTLFFFQSKCNVAAANQKKQKIERAPTMTHTSQPKGEGRSFTTKTDSLGQSRLFQTFVDTRENRLPKSENELPSLATCQRGEPRALYADTKTSRTCFYNFDAQNIRERERESERKNSLLNLARRGSQRSSCGQQ